MSDQIVGAMKALSEPARLAIEKLAGGIAKVYEPIHIRRIAAANADNEFIKAVGNEDVATLLKAAEDREKYRKIRQELNLRQIADRSSRLFEAGTPADSAPPADEWVDEFTDRSKEASSDELRELWARLYVAETNHRGSIPKRVLRVIRDLDASLAASFTYLLGCTITNDPGQIVALIFKECFSGLDFTDRNLRELQDVGLVEPPSLGTIVIGDGFYKLANDSYFRLTFRDGKSWTVHSVYLTSAGIAIAAVVERSVNAQYVKNLCTAVTVAGAQVEYSIRATAKPE